MSDGKRRDVSDNQNVSSHPDWQVVSGLHVTLCVWKYHIIMSRMAAKTARKHREKGRDKLKDTVRLRPYAPSCPPSLYPTCDYDPRPPV